MVGFLVRKSWIASCLDGRGQRFISGIITSTISTTMLKLTSVHKSSQLVIAIEIFLFLASLVLVFEVSRTLLNNDETK